MVHTAIQHVKQAPNGPEVVASVPASPKSKSGIVVGHATNHILGRIDTINKSPQSEESPRYQKLVKEDV